MRPPRRGDQRIAFGNTKKSDQAGTEPWNSASSKSLPHWRANWEASLRAGFASLFAAEGIALDCADPGQLVLFPEMDVDAPVPEITTACWGILHKSPADVMCATQRMVVKRKGAAECAVVACTLLPHDQRFDYGARLAGALAPVKLNHPHCAKFCVLGGGSCST